MNKYPNLLLDNQLCFSLYSATNAITRYYRLYLKELGITYTQYLVLIALWEGDCKKASDIASMLKLDLPTITPMLKKLETNTDLVVGSRYVNGVNVVNWPMSRILLSYFASIYIQILTSMPIKDATAGFVGYRRRVLESISLDQVKFVGYAFQIEMKYRAWIKKFNVEEHPIIFTNRVLGKSKMNSNIIWEALYGVLFLRINKRRLK